MGPARGLRWSRSGFEHLNFAAVASSSDYRDVLDLRAGDRVVTWPGAGGPGAWSPTRPGGLIGVDLSRVGIRVVAQRAVARHLAGAAFTVANINRLPLVDSCAVGVMSLDSLQYAPDKRTTFAEAAGVLVHGGRFALTAFEVDSVRVRDVPVLGVDPVVDYSTSLRDVGFTVDTYEGMLGWRQRLVGAYSAVIAGQPTLRPELGMTPWMRCWGRCH